MPIVVPCESCGRELKAPDGFHGRRARCPHCGAVVRLEPQHEDLADGGWPNETGRTPADYPPASARSRERRLCPACGEAVPVGATRCPMCGERLAGEPASAAQGPPLAAFASVVLGSVAALSVCFLAVSGPAALLAIVLGGIGLVKARRGGRGEGLAIGGVVFGLIVLGVWFLLLVLRLAAAAALEA